MAEATATQTGGSSPEQMTGQTELEFYPQATGGFLMEKEDGSSVFVEVDTLEEDTHGGVATRLDAYRITKDTLAEDGSQSGHTLSYNVRTNIPAALASDTLAQSTTPWTTREGKGGFNNRLMERLNGVGYGTIFVEPRGGAIRAGLSESADNMNYIGHIARWFRPASTDIRPDEALYVGKSRAAAIGFGVMSAYADVTAPCFTRPGTMKELPRDAAQLSLEALELVKHIAGLNPKEVLGLRKTFSAHPVDALHTVLTIPQLRNGDAGRLFWANPEGFTNITLFDKDGWSQPEEAARMFDGRPNTNVSVLNGRHMTLAHPAIIDSVIDRFETIAEMRGFDGGFDRVDFDYIAGIQRVEPKGSLGKVSLGTVIKAGYNLAAAR